MWLRANPVTYTSGRPTWADIRKGRRATERARLIHRLAELLEEYEADRKQQRMVVTKRIQSLTILVGGQRAAFFGDGELRFTTWARERYSDDERSSALGFLAAPGSRRRHLCFGAERGPHRRHDGERSRDGEVGRRRRCRRLQAVGASGTQFCFNDGSNMCDDGPTRIGCDASWRSRRAPR